MEKKESSKNKLATGLLIFAIVVIVLSLAYLVYFKVTDKKQNEEIETQTSENAYSGEIENEVENETENTVFVQTIEETDNLKQGEYVIVGMEISPDEENYGIESIEIKENNEFSINLPLGTGYLGTYSIEDNKIKCIATKQEENEGGGQKTEDIKAIEFTFEIAEEENIKYIGADSDEPEFELTKGKTYTLTKED